MENYTYLGSTISSNLSLEDELNIQIGKAATSMAHLAKRVWDNSMLTINTKIKVCQVCILNTLLYSSKTWTLYCYQERRLNVFNVFHLHNLRRILGILRTTFQTKMFSHRRDYLVCLLYSPRDVRVGSVMSATWTPAECLKTCCTANLPLAPGQ